MSGAHGNTYTLSARSRIAQASVASPELHTSREQLPPRWDAHRKPQQRPRSSRDNMLKFSCRDMTREPNLGSASDAARDPPAPQHALSARLRRVLRARAGSLAQLRSLPLLLHVLDAASSPTPSSLPVRKPIIIVCVVQFNFSRRSCFDIFTSFSR